MRMLIVVGMALAIVNCGTAQTNGAVSAGTAGQGMVSEIEQITRLLHERIEAIRAKNVSASMRSLSPEIIAFEMVAPLSLPPGAARDSESTARWLAGWQDLDVEVRDLVIHASADVAFAHSLNRLTGTTTGGRRVDIWMRSTLGLRKEQGLWRIVHAHTSVPVGEDGRAALDLKP